MPDASDLPILLDGDTGYGNFNNVRRLVKKLEQRGIAGVCIEDKQFPKTNSFINSEAHPLADMEVLRQDQGRQGFAKRSELFDRRARGSADRGLGHGRSVEACRGVSAGGRGRDPDSLEALEARRNSHVRARVGGARSAVIVPTKYYKTTSTPTDVFR